jgi:glycosyltransferase involved in cell wall biosynthesis
MLLLPSFNSGPRLVATMREARARWPHVWVVCDGVTDGSDAAARALEGEGLRVLSLPENGGKGAAVLAGMKAALAEGFTHSLVMDADGQHDAGEIEAFFSASRQAPDRLIAGVPVFGPDAPIERVRGRLVGNTLARCETLDSGPRDALFGFRVYPIQPSVKILESVRGARRFDFDTVLGVRLAWAGVPAINLPVRVCYPRKSEGGVTHFRYWRDNLLLARAHFRLFLGLAARLPVLLRNRRLIRFSP